MNVIGLTMIIVTIFEQKPPQPSLDVMGLIPDLYPRKIKTIDIPSFA